MSSQQSDNHAWQWDEAAWGDSPAAPTAPEQVPEPDAPCGWSASLRRLLRWASTPS